MFIFSNGDKCDYSEQMEQQKIAIIKIELAILNRKAKDELNYRKRAKKAYYKYSHLIPQTTISDMINLSRLSLRSM